MSTVGPQNEPHWQRDSSGHQQTKAPSSPPIAESYLSGTTYRRDCKGSQTPKRAISKKRWPTLHLDQARSRFTASDRALCRDRHGK